MHSCHKGREDHTPSRAGPSWRCLSSGAHLQRLRRRGHLTHAAKARWTGRAEPDTTDGKTGIAIENRFGPFLGKACLCKGPTLAFPLLNSLSIEFQSRLHALLPILANLLAHICYFYCSPTRNLPLCLFRTSFSPGGGAWSETRLNIPGKDYVALSPNAALSAVPVGRRPVSPVKQALSQKAQGLIK